LTSGKEVWNYQDRKAASQPAFYVIPKQYLQKFLKTTRENMGDKINGSLNRMEGMNKI
jgi:hypothetical protein